MLPCHALRAVASQSGFQARPRQTRHRAQVQASQQQQETQRRRSCRADLSEQAVPPVTSDDSRATPVRPQVAAAAAAASAACTALFPEAASAALHFGSEPANALSLPTWAIHVASVVEWVAAMDLIWRLGDAQGRPAWRALVWGMLPLHASSLTACTYHFFYNAPSLAGLVTLQAALTAFGNCTLTLGALQVAKSYEEKQDSSADGRGWFAGFQDIGASLSKPEEQDFIKQGAVVSVVAAAAIKFGSLALDLPFEPSYGAALALIFGPTAATGAVFALRAAAGGKEGDALAKE